MLEAGEQGGEEARVAAQEEIGRLGAQAKALRE